jgi:hypothetical protein
MRSPGEERRSRMAERFWLADRYYQQCYRESQSNSENYSGDDEADRDEAAGGPQTDAERCAERYDGPELRDPQHPEYPWREFQSFHGALTPEEKVEVSQPG